MVVDARWDEDGCGKDGTWDWAGEVGSGSLGSPAPVLGSDEITVTTRVSCWLHAHTHAHACIYCHGYHLLAGSVVVVCVWCWWVVGGSGKPVCFS